MNRRLQVISAGIGLLLAWVVIAGVTQQTDRAGMPRLPSGLEVSNSDFGALIEELSEPEGYFDTDNFITNETSYLHVVDKLKDHVRPGGVYLGVGPDQNFSYIVHTNPALAIITDVRRQNMLQHLLFKVLIEQAENRLDYLCTLLARDCTEVSATSPLPQMLESVRVAPENRPALEDAIVQVRRTLLAAYGLNLDPVDLEQIAYVHRAFASAGLRMRFSSFGRPSTGYPTLEEILLERDLEGDYQSYMATEELFERLQRFQAENRLIPIVGDFAGRKALPEVAAFLSEHELEVSVFYVSNVEFYLAGLPGWDAYIDNVRQFPFRNDAVFIRAYFPTGWPLHPSNVPGHRPTSVVQDVAGFLDDAQSRPQWNYWDVVTRYLK